MPRSNRSNSKSSSRQRTYSGSNHNSNSITTTNSTPTTKSATPVNPIAPISIESQKPSIMSSVKYGIASGYGWGIGTSLARRIFGGVTNPNNTSINNTPINNTTEGIPVTKCFTETENYKKCTEKFGVDFCQTELDFLNKCKETIN
jgi:hypothetical protein